MRVILSRNPLFSLPGKKETENSEKEMEKTKRMENNKQDRGFWRKFSNKYNLGFMLMGRIRILWRISG